MKKISFKLESNDSNINGYFNSLNGEGIIKFKVNDTIYYLDINNNTLKHENNEVITLIDVNNSIIKMQLLECNYSLDIPITILEQINKDDLFKIKYKIEEDPILIEIKLMKN